MKKKKNKRKAIACVLIVYGTCIAPTKCHNALNEKRKINKRKAITCVWHVYYIGVA